MVPLPLPLPLALWEVDDVVVGALVGVGAGCGVEVTAEDRVVEVDDDDGSVEVTGG